MFIETMEILILNQNKIECIYNNMPGFKEYLASSSGKVIYVSIFYHIIKKSNSLNQISLPQKMKV